MRIQDKCAIITGAARGIGRQFATDLLKAGAKVSICDVNEDYLDETKESFQQKGYNIDTYKVDVTSEEEVVEFYNKVAEKNRGIDISINNAGVASDNLLIKKTEKGIDKFPIEAWEKVINVNLTGVFLCAREAAYQMVKYNKEGVIISMSSISREGNFGQTNYTATKAGVAAMTVTWAKELSKYNIRVAAIAPGYIKTEMTDSIPENVKKKISNMIPLKRFGSKEEISKTLFYIIENDYFTGRTIEIDGGLRL